MEYNLLKTIEGGIGCPFIPNESYPRLSPFPSTDFVNPGLGQIARLHDFYVPLYSNRHLHEIKKKVSLDNLEGSGAVENENDSMNETETETDDQMKEDPEKFNLENGKRLGPEIQDSFLHPKLIKTNKIVFETATKAKQSKSLPKDAKLNMSNSFVKSPKHKFQFY